MSVQRLQQVAWEWIQARGIHTVRARNGFPCGITNHDLMVELAKRGEE